MQQTNKYLFLFIFCTVILVAVFYLFMTYAENPKKGEVITDNSASNLLTEKKFEISTTFYELHTSGESLFCTSDFQKTYGPDSYDTLYTDGFARTAVTYAFINPADNYIVHLNILDEKIYTWASTSNSGRVDQIGSYSNSDELAANLPLEIAIQWDVERTYSCTSWVPVDSMFALPSTIDFKAAVRE